jgi:hypothetical protein
MCQFCEFRKECKKIDGAVELWSYTGLFRADRALRRGAPTSTTEPPVRPPAVIEEEPVEVLEAAKVTEPEEEAILSSGGSDD